MDSNERPTDYGVSSSVPFLKLADAETTDMGFRRKEVPGLKQQGMEGTRFSQY